MRVGLAIGCTPTEAFRRVTPLDYLLLAAFNEVEPFGPRQDDYRAAVVASAMAGKLDAPRLFPSLKPPPRTGDGGRAFRAWAANRLPPRPPGA